MFLGVKTKLTPVKISRFLHVKMNYTREKTEKTLQKCAWKSFFPREIFGKSHAWKPILTHVKNIEHYTREKEKMPVKNKAEFLLKYLSKMG